MLQRVPAGAETRDRHQTRSAAAMGAPSRAGRHVCAGESRGAQNATTATRSAQGYTARRSPADRASRTLCGVRARSWDAAVTRRQRPLHLFLVSIGDETRRLKSVRVSRKEDLQGFFYRFRRVRPSYLYAAERCYTYLLTYLYMYSKSGSTLSVTSQTEIAL